MKDLVEAFILVAALLVSIYWLVEPFIKSECSCECRKCNEKRVQKVK
jgi:hypothetical protein